MGMKLIVSCNDVGKVKGKRKLVLVTMMAMARKQWITGSNDVIAWFSKKKKKFLCCTSGIYCNVALM